MFFEHRWCRFALRRCDLPPRSSSAGTGGTLSARLASKRESLSRYTSAQCTIVKLSHCTSQNCHTANQNFILGIFFRLGLNPKLCPVCRQRITGRATGMENFLKVLLFHKSTACRNCRQILKKTFVFPTKKISFHTQDILSAQQAPHQG